MADLETAMKQSLCEALADCDVDRTRPARTDFLARPAGLWAMSPLTLTDHADIALLIATAEVTGQAGTSKG